MKDLCIPVCYFPTAVIAVGDYSNSLSFAAENVSPSIAAKLLSRQQPTDLLQRCFTECLEFNLYLSSTHGISFNVEAVHNIIYNAQRFNEISVVVINNQEIQQSIEIAQQINPTKAQKLLLFKTGEESLALAALNNGYIDYCINKSDNHFEHEIQQALEELRYRYFQKLSHTVVDMLAVTVPTCLTDPAFRNFFTALCCEQQIVEFYLTETSGSYLLFNNNGEASCLLVKNQQDIYHYYELAIDNQAPAQLIKQLQEGEKLPYFWQNDAYYSLEWQEWEKYLYPAQKFQGKEVYYYTLLNQPALLRLQQQQIVPYQVFLADSLSHS